MSTIRGALAAIVVSASGVLAMGYVTLAAMVHYIENQENKP